jgi:hypothetical protein
MEVKMKLVLNLRLGLVTDVSDCVVNFKRRHRGEM